MSTMYADADPRSGLSTAKAAPAPTYLMSILRGIEGESADEIAYTKKRGSLEYQLSVDEVTILQIYRSGGDPP